MLRNGSVIFLWYNSWMRQLDNCCVSSRHKTFLRPTRKRPGKR